MSIPYDYNPLGVDDNGGYIIFSDGVSEYKFTGNFDEAKSTGNMFFAVTTFQLGAISVARWRVNLPKVVTTATMFTNNTRLVSFEGNMPNVTNATSMFNGCSNLTSFSGDISNLTNGSNMFAYCNLDEVSVLRILNSIPTYTSDTHNLHLGKRTNYLNSAEIATLLGTTTPIAAATNYAYKGWTITVTT